MTSKQYYHHAISSSLQDIITLRTTGSGFCAPKNAAMFLSDVVLIEFQRSHHLNVCMVNCMKQTPSLLH